MAADEKLMGDIHSMTANVMLNALKAYEKAGDVDLAEMAPSEALASLALIANPSPALLNAVTKFLKDSDITTAPEVNDTQEKLREQLKKRRNKTPGSNVLTLPLAEEA